MNLVALIIDSLRLQRPVYVCLELIPKVGREVVDIGPACVPLSAARTEHIVFAPVVDNHHCCKAMAARQGHFGVLWGVFDEWAVWKK